MSRMLHAYWFGATDDAKAPPRVHLRVFVKFDGKCQCGCNRKIAPGEAWQLDHVVALINGGSNSEGNLQPLLTEHHKNKTRVDVAEKAKTYAKRSKHLGIKRTGRTIPGRRFDGTPIPSRMRT
jgi:5-methylcytosine-specific restriction endonuclease McrA